MNMNTKILWLSDNLYSGFGSTKEDQDLVFANMLEFARSVARPTTEFVVNTLTHTVGAYAPGHAYPTCFPCGPGRADGAARAAASVEVVALFRKMPYESLAGVHIGDEELYAAIPSSQLICAPSIHQRTILPLSTSSITDCSGTMPTPMSASTIRRIACCLLKSNAT